MSLLKTLNGFSDGRARRAVKSHPSTRPKPMLRQSWTASMQFALRSMLEVLKVQDEHFTLLMNVLQLGFDPSTISSRNVRLLLSSPLCSTRKITFCTSRVATAIVASNEPTTQTSSVCEQPWHLSSQLIVAVFCMNCSSQVHPLKMGTFRRMAAQIPCKSLGSS